MFLRPGHPLLTGLRFFARVGTTGSIPVTARGGGPGVVTLGSGSYTVLRSGGALQGDGAATVVTFDSFPNYWLPTARDLTVICRCRASTGAQTAGVVASRNSTHTLGWQILFSNFAPGGVEDGYNFAVFSTAGKFVEGQDLIGSAAQSGKDVVVAGTWSQAATTASLYTRQPGDPAARFRSSNTNTNSSGISAEPWDVRSTAPVLTHQLNNISAWFNGAVAWVAVFDRVLLPAEIAAWSRDEAWPFAEPEAPAVLVAPVPAGSPELRFGPALPGAPWVRPVGEVTPPVFPPPPPPVPAGGFQVFQPEVRYGPRLPGAPWVYESHGVGSTVPAAPPPPPALPGAQILQAESRFGPFPFAPWRGGVDPGANTFPPPVPPAPPVPPTPVSRGGPARPLIAREPPADSRLRRLTEVVTQVFNSLSGSNQLVQTAPTAWTVSTSFVEVFSPGPTNDSTQGAHPGFTWIHSVTGAVYICVSAAPGAAVWKLIA